MTMLNFMSLIEKKKNTGKQGGNTYRMKSARADQKFMKFTVNKTWYQYIVIQFSSNDVINIYECVIQ